jgi:hypothetical protein
VSNALRLPAIAPYPKINQSDSQSEEIFWGASTT